MMGISIHRMLIHLILLGGFLVASLKIGDWSSCSATCQAGEEPGHRYRISHCDDPNRGDCNAPAPEKFPCNLPKCPVDGGWGRWGEWSGCSQTCGSGVRHQTRDCDNPVPSAGGRYCEGHHERLEYCSGNPCPVPTFWTGWTDWTKCDDCKHGAQRIRRRYCTPKTACAKPHEDDKKNCTYDTTKCPVDGKWGPWGTWSDCSVTCDFANGTRTKARKCTMPERGGKPCEGIDTKKGREHKPCNGSVQCPVDCQWLQWGPWSKLGEDRLRLRNRTHAINGGRTCLGESNQIEYLTEKGSGSGEGDGSKGDGTGSGEDNTSGNEDTTTGDVNNRGGRSTRVDEEIEGNPSGSGD